MNAITRHSENLVVRSGGWRRRLFAFAFIGVSIVFTFLLVTSFYPGENFIDRLGVAYAALWQPTTQRPFTFIMRENPWLLIIPAISITLSVRSLTPLTDWRRAGPMYFALGVECCARARVLAGSASLNNANLVRLSRSVSLRHFR